MVLIKLLTVYMSGMLTAIRNDDENQLKTELNKIYEEMEIITKEEFKELINYHGDVCISILYAHPSFGRGC